MEKEGDPRRDEEKEKMKKKVRKIGAFLTACMFALTCLVIPQDAFASERTGSLTIYYHGITPQGNQAVLSGAEFSLYEAGKKIENEWKLQGAFEVSGVDLTDMSSSGQRKVAEQLYNFTVKENLVGESRTTGSNGRVLFRNLTEGMYLCVPRGEVSHDNGLFRSAPFLVFIPEVDENGNVRYDVTVEPKNEWGENETKPQEPVPPQEEPENKKENGAKTGDENNIWFYVWILFGCAGIVMFAGKKGR